MTELETLQRAKMYMEKLAQGLDPISDREMQEDSVLNQVRLARCFFYVSNVLGQVIDNGGVVGSKPKLLPFAIDAEQLSKIQPSPEPIRITQFVDLIAAAVDQPQMKKLSTTSVTNWLLGKGFLEKLTDADGKSRRIPTQNGRLLGLSTQLRQGQYGEYMAVYYSLEAQQFILDHLPAILEEK